VLEGEPVAVKLLRPGLAATVRQDLVLLDTLAAPLNAAFPTLDATGLIAEFRERVADELDLEHEAQMQRRFHRALRSHPFLSVPEPVTRLAHAGVLVSAWAEGVPIANAPDLDMAAARLLSFVIGAARFGVMHADPDPDDVLVQPTGELTILDFGATRTMSPNRVDSTQAALEAFATGDAAAFGAALAKLNVLPEPEATTALELARYALGTNSTRLDTHALAAVHERLLERREDLRRLTETAALPPEDLWPARAVLQLFAAIARLGASGDWLELARVALRDGWDARAGLA
jgi:predicted unusual protein kinase regulating ubiquinone biosynthesis (AarF/ABC1/UbiB family)